MVKAEPADWLRHWQSSAAASHVPGNCCCADARAWRYPLPWSKGLTANPIVSAQNFAIRSGMVVMTDTWESMTREEIAAANP